MYRHLFVLNCLTMAPWLPLESFALKPWYSVNLDSEMGHKSGSDTYIINQKPEKKEQRKRKEHERVSQIGGGLLKHLKWQ